MVIIMGVYIKNLNIKTGIVNPVLLAVDLQGAKSIIAELININGEYKTSLGLTIPEFIYQKKLKLAVCEVVSADVGNHMVEQYMIDKFKIGRYIPIKNDEYNWAMHHIVSANLVCVRGAESFRSVKPVFDNYYMFYVRIGVNCFKLVQEYGISHTKLVEICLTRSNRACSYC